jgi:hypothetical protein
MTDDFFSAKAATKAAIRVNAFSFFQPAFSGILQAWGRLWRRF